MSTGVSLQLTRDCRAQVIPAGDEVILPAGSDVQITQTLGGSATVRHNMGLFRLPPEELDALGAESAEAIRRETVAIPSESGEFGEERIWEALRTVFDPEIPVNIVDLGLIYDLQTTAGPEGGQNVQIKMTLTARGCGMGPVIADDARQRIEQIPEVHAAQVEIVWDPQWTPHMISPAGRQKLGLN